MSGRFLTVSFATALHLNLDTQVVLKIYIINNIDIMTVSFSSIILFPLENKMTLRSMRAVGVVTVVENPCT